MDFKEICERLANKLYQGDWVYLLKQLPDCFIQTLVTSPPYWGLRDYGTALWEGGDPTCDHFVSKLTSDKCTLYADVEKSKRIETGLPYKKKCGKCGATRIDAQLGIETTPEEYINKLVDGFREVKRVLRDDGTLWVNIGDCYAGSGRGEGVNTDTGSKQDTNVGSHGLSKCPPITGIKSKDLVGIPWMFAFAMRADGWYLRKDVIWFKPNPMPESVTDRPTTSKDYIFLFSKKPQYFYDRFAIFEPFTDARMGNAGTYKDKYAETADGGKARSLGIRHDTATRTKGWDKGKIIGGKNRRDIWQFPIGHTKEKHYASFPPMLPQLCIKAGTSEKGACPKCGAPWMRLVSIKQVETRPGLDTKVAGISSVEGKRDPKRHVSINYELGWAPTCVCGIKETVPCVVIDPFVGRGTTAIKAKEMGRSFIGLELNPAYIKMAIENLANTKQKDSKSDFSKFFRSG